MNVSRKSSLPSSLKFASLVLAGAVLGLGSLAAADDYKVDPVHSSAIFGAHHFNAGYVYGLVDGANGTISFDAGDPGSAKFDVSIDFTTLNTLNQRRDQDLKGPGWFNVKQFPTGTFKSTAVKKTGDNTMDVTGDLTLHGVTKSVTIPIAYTGTGKGMQGETRSGFEATFTVKRADFEMNAMPGAVGDDIKITVALEAIKQ